MNLKEYKSLCEIHQPIIVSKDKKSRFKHVAINIDKHLVYQYKVDEQLFVNCNEKKCDFLVINDEKHTAYFIELKGSHILEAIKQLKSSYNLLSIELVGYEIFYRIISKSNTHAINSTEYIKFKKKYKNVECITNKDMNEAI